MFSKNEYYFQDLGDILNDEDENDIDYLRSQHHDLGKEFRQFVIDYDISDKLIKESTLNTFLREKPFTHVLKGEEPVIDDNDLKKYPIINNSEIKESINIVLKEQQSETNNNSKKQSKTNNKQRKKH